MKHINPSKLRGKFLGEMDDFLTEFVQVAKGEKEKFTSGNNFAITQSWELLKDIMKIADDPVPIAWSDATTRGRIDDVLNQVASGALTPDQGKKVMALVSMGFEMTDLQEIMSKMDTLSPA
jgi:hypothetical protein